MGLLFKTANGVVNLIPEQNNIDDTQAAADMTYSSEKQEAEYPITTTASTSPVSTASGNPRKITIFGKSEVVDGSIVSAGEGWATVDLGTLRWDYNHTADNCKVYYTVSLRNVANLSNNNYICDKFFNGSVNTPYKTLYSSNSNVVYFSVGVNEDSNAITGNMVYQLADPTQGNCIAIKTDNGSGIDGTMATFETGTPLRGVPDTDVRDVMAWDGTAGTVTKKCGKVRLADLTWEINSTIFYADIFYAKYQTAFLTTKYTNIGIKTFSQMQTADDKSIAIGSGSDARIFIKDTDYTTVSDFVASLGDAELVYELATPTTEQFTASENNSFAALQTYTPQTAIAINDSPEFEAEAYAGTANGQAVADLEEKVQKQIDDIKLEREHFCYSYKIDMNNSDPFTNCKPHFDQRYGCDNFNFTSAHMDYANDRFDYGSWEGFIRRIARPCMLKYDGTVDYYLDPDDYSKKITGEASDVADLNYNGNVMVELEKLYFKRYTHNGIQYCFISDRKLDKSFKCYAHHDKYGKELDYIYRAAYDGSYDGTRLRSISGIDYHNLNTLTVNKIMSNTTRAEEIAFAQANNVASEQGEGWYILHKSEWDYINDILFLIGMSTDVQTTFGRGRDSGYVGVKDTGIVSTGTMDDKGLFWGKNDSSAGVKVLGIENHWANLHKSMAGYINASGTQKIKQTYGTEDGSTVVGFNTDGTGYVAITGATPTMGGSSASGGGYITAWKYNDYGLIPYECTSAGSSVKFIPDYFYFNNNQTNFVIVGGDSNASLSCGLMTDLNNVVDARRCFVGAVLSYKGKVA